jgi:hypothetical protein
MLFLTPSLYSTHHNIFERHHRFIGWLGLAVGTLMLMFYLPTEGLCFISSHGSLLSWETHMTFKLVDGVLMETFLSTPKNFGSR